MNNELKNKIKKYNSELKGKKFIVKQTFIDPFDEDIIFTLPKLDKHGIADIIWEGTTHGSYYPVANILKLVNEGNWIIINE